MSYRAGEVGDHAEAWTRGEERIVAFVDIIGFGSELQKLEAKPEHLPRMVQALLGGRSIAESSACEYDLSGLLVGQEGDETFAADRQEVFFSDCAMVSARCVPGALDDVLQVVLDYARHLLGEGFFLRGGIARGLAVHRGSLVVGPAVLKAYLIERDAAHYPRIVIEDDVAREILGIEDSPNPVATIRRSEDGLYFVDILATLGLRRGGGEILSATRELVIRRLAEAGTLANQAKWRWLAAQYNRAVECVESSGGSGDLPPTIQAPGVSHLG